MTDDLARTLREMVALLERPGLSYMAVGSIAALAHGRMRTTADFDVVVELDEKRLDALLGALPEERFYVRELIELAGARLDLTYLRQWAAELELVHELEAALTFTA